MKSRKRLYGISLAVLLLVSAALYYFVGKNKEAKATYKEHVVARGTLEVSVQATGTIQPENRLVVKPQIAGRIDEILIQEGQKVRSGQVLAWMSSSDRAALVDMARSASPEEQARWQEIYKPTPIIAPLGGVVISKQVERGQTVATNDTIFVISDRLIILAQVDETDLGKIALGQNVEIRVDAYSDQTVNGKVIRIAYESKQVNNVTIYEIRILPEDIPSFMRAGMTTSVKFLQNRKENVLTVPVSFVRRSSDAPDNDPNEMNRPLEPGDKATVLLKTADKKAPRVEKLVTVGISNGRSIVITDGLDEGSVILQVEQADNTVEKSSNPFSPFGPPRQKRK